MNRFQDVLSPLHSPKNQFINLNDKLNRLTSHRVVFNLAIKYFIYQVHKLNKWLNENLRVKNNGLRKLKFYARTNQQTKLPSVQRTDNASNHDCLLPECKQRHIL